ncbi:4,5-DOPA dioxygenase extradiol [Flavobacterium sp. HXWNR69]|uniref:4,5-DOPA dioxygenase extradiol n=1 Tax=Flavobacterium fragile TaxID=2949085 RepID=A0ABT0TG34_9FLAO|nr:4,5-DOPA dioxygenase extradiol [Flavobacterium sp. HXWNR69]MCL9769928.1 4,5-DOPA dioxygenase extradiol [Flavobacterium sp. HXWNR69]
MNRKNFITLLSGGVAMASIQPFYDWTKGLGEEEEKMPVLFIGHGSPMNAIEDNIFSKRWQQMGKEIPTPKAVVVVSAHWLTKGTMVTAMPNPKTIHDFGGFPQALFEVQYPAPGSPELATEIQKLITNPAVELDHDWGLDHGTWSVVKHMYPNADIPVLQLSIDYYKPAAYHYELAKQLLALRKKGVLIIGSGNMVHNLRMVAWDKLNEPEYGFDWALEMNDVFKNKISNGFHKELIQYEKLHKAATLAIPTPDHYYPLLYILALQTDNDKVEFFNDKAVGGSLTMTSVKIG